MGPAEGLEEISPNQWRLTVILNSADVERLTKLGALAKPKNLSVGDTIRRFIRSSFVGWAAGPQKIQPVVITEKK